MIALAGDFAWTILSFVVALSIIVAVHEYGHYIVGRWSGIKADVFSLGFGPRLFGWQDRRGTYWQIAAIPLGGYVRFMGDDNAASVGPGSEVDPEQRRHTLTGAPLWARFATVSAGPVFNFILSIAIFAGMALWQGMPVDKVQIGRIAALPESIVSELRPGDEVLAVDGQPVTGWADLFAAELKSDGTHDWTVSRAGDQLTVKGPDPVPPIIGGVAPRSAASDAGLKAGDVITAIEGAPVTRFEQIREAVDKAQGAPVLLRVWREGAGEADYAVRAAERDLPTATGYEKRWLIGISGGGFFDPATRPTGPGEALTQGVSRTWEIIVSSISGLAAMITGQIDTCNIGGAISIAETTAEAASAGGGNFIWWIAILSAAIGFLNLLPIPVLDGGHLMFYLYEAIARRPVPARIANLITLAGLSLVLALMVFGLSNDLLCP